MIEISRNSRKILKISKETRNIKRYSGILESIKHDKGYSKPRKNIAENRESLWVLLNMFPQPSRLHAKT